MNCLCCDVNKVKDQQVILFCTADAFRYSCTFIRASDLLTYKHGQAIYIRDYGDGVCGKYKGNKGAGLNYGPMGG